MPNADEREKLAAWFNYHPSRPEQVPRYERITEAARAFAVAIMDCTMPSADQSAALRLVREARMTANAAIACAEAPPASGAQ